jgi:hypothetical protein
MCTFDVSLISTMPTKHGGSSVQYGQNITSTNKVSSPSTTVLPSPKERRVTVPGIGMAVQVSYIQMSKFHYLVISFLNLVA